MKALFYVLSLLAILAGAFFSNNLKSNFIEQQEVRSDTEDRNKKITASADKTEQNLGAEKDALRGAQSDQAEVQATIETLQSDISSLGKDLQRVSNEVEQQQITIEDAAKAMAAAQQALQDLDIPGPVTAANIGDTIQGFEDDKKALVQEIGEIETVIEGATNAVANNRDEIGRQQDRQAARVANARRNTLSARITAVDQNWGFVVIGAGRNSGFSPQDRLIVERSGRRIAEVIPSSIEATQTIAEIDLDTIAPGVALQPGDRVILSKAN